MPRRLLLLASLAAAAVPLVLASPVSAGSAGPAPASHVQVKVLGAWNGTLYRGRPAAQRFMVGSVQQILVNRDRAGARKARLNWGVCLVKYAKAQAAAMARRDAMYHSNIARMFSCRLGSRQVGENVGVVQTGGASLSQSTLDSIVNQAFMHSPHHRANIMGPYHFVATAWSRAANGDYFIAVEFA